jgi:HSP90 family molecular chaperone
LVGESLEKVKNSPLLERAKVADIEVVYMTDAIDEYVVNHITEFAGQKLINLAKDNVKFKEDSEKEKKVQEARNKSWEPFLKWLKEVLGNKIEKAILSTRLTDTPCVLVAAQYSPSAYMEQIMKAQALADSNAAKQQSRRVMELNHRHPLVDELRRRWTENPTDDTARDMATLLYDTAALQSGFSLDDTNVFASRLHRVMKQGLNLDTNAPLVEEEEYDIEEEDDDDSTEQTEQHEQHDQQENTEQEPATQKGTHQRTTEEKDEL